MSAKEWATWKTHSSVIRSKHNLPKQSKSWTGRPGICLRGVPNLDRVHDVIDCAFSIHRAKNPKASTKELVDGLMVDISQAVQRKPWSVGARTVTTRTHFYVFSEDCSLAGASHMKLMGWPTSRLGQQFTDHELRVLAGESYSLPWNAVFHALLYCNPFGEWWQ